MDDMYPPAGSCRYEIPKPLRYNGFSTTPIKGEDSEDIVRWLTATPLFKLRFWKLLLLGLLILSAGHFTITVFRHNGSHPMFVLNKSTTKRSLHIDCSYSNLSLDKSASVVWTDQPKTRYDNQLISQKVKEHSVSALVRAKMNKDCYVMKFATTSFDFLNYSVVQSPSEDDGRVLLNSRSHNGSSYTIPELKLCPPIPPNLEGLCKVVLENVPSLDVQEKLNGVLSPGGRFKPSECRSRHKVAVIIPFRDRASHLAIFLFNVHPFLQKQQIDYAIFIIEQAGKIKFNRASLLNVGFLEALKLYPYDCFIFHDIDLIPEDDRNLYTCPQQPRHMSVAINTMRYKLPYNDIFGGVSAMTVSQFREVNGFSNKFWGWGAEDDDMSNRIKFHGLYISRYPANVARYTMMPHKKDRPNPHRYKVLNDGRKNFNKDGLSSLKYKVLNVQLKALYTWINVELPKL